MNNKILKILVSSCITALLVGCASSKKALHKSIESKLNRSFYNNQFTGLLVVNPITKDTLYTKNSSKYFTPASNTKIFTLYTALKTLPKKIPALRYVEKNDTLYFEGTGDPSFLHPYLKDSTVFYFLKKHKNLAFNLGNFQDTRFGPGWAWEDYDSGFSPERSSFPIYGNVASISKTFPSQIIPHYFKDSLLFISNNRNRDQEHNRFYVDEYRTDTLSVPFKIGSNTIQHLLQDALNKPITVSNKMPINKTSTLYGIEADSLYIQLMHESDNFIAEQLLLLAASEISDTLNSKIAITYTLDSLVPNLPQQPRWVDGSGLSRYNLFTPQSLVYILDRLYTEVPQERLFEIFPIGGAPGTLKNWYAGSPEPYIYAKSGSFGNNYCLSGYLLTKSGKVLIFSFMNNHFRTSPSQVKKQMEALFEEIRDTY